MLTHGQLVTAADPMSVEALLAAVAPEAVSRRFTIIDGFEATITVAEARSLGVHPAVRRLEHNVSVTATVDGARRDFGTDAAAATFGVGGPWELGGRVDLVVQTLVHGCHPTRPVPPTKAIA